MQNNLKCACHGEDLIPFLQVANTPLANGFLRKEDLNLDEPSFPLTLCLCKKSKLVQLSYQVEPEKMFSHYVYVTSTSKTFRKHFLDLANHIVDTFNLQKEDLVIDIGSNDGLLLGEIQKRGVLVLGVEPASNIAKIANEKGVETINGFFSKEICDEVIASKKRPKIITATNVYAHIPNLNRVTENIKYLMDDDTTFIIEVQYFCDMVLLKTFDNVYHEHVFYWTMTSLRNFLLDFDMSIFDVEHVDTHGGSLRVYIKKSNGNQLLSDNVKNLLEKEDKLGVNEISYYEHFSTSLNSVRGELQNLMKSLVDQNKRIVGYGAPAKSTTLLHYCQITNKQIEYIVDDNPLKVSLYTPGTHIEIMERNSLLNDNVDYVLILAWNFAEEIIEKNKELLNKGVKFIIPFPQLRIVGRDEKC